MILKRRTYSVTPYRKEDDEDVEMHNALDCLDKYLQQCGLVNHGKLSTETTNEDMLGRENERKKFKLSIHFGSSVIQRDSYYP